MSQMKGLWGILPGIHNKAWNEILLAANSYLKSYSGDLVADFFYTKIHYE